MIANGVLLLVVAGCAALLLGVPVEEVLSVADNPVSRVAVVTFSMSLVGLVALSFSMHLLLHRHKKMASELEEMRKLVEAGHARFSALATTADALEERVESVLDGLQDEMAAERERMRAQARAYLVHTRQQGATTASPARANGREGGER